MTVVLRAAEARVVVDPTDGGRITSLCVRGRELLGGVGDGVMEHGSFVMAPWAGRIRSGLLEYSGRVHKLPLRLHPHAGHGTVLDHPWSVDEVDESSMRISCDLQPPWPGAGRVTQSIALTNTALVQQVTVAAADQPFPASIGWHPWFRRQLTTGESIALAFAADAMLLRDDVGLPSGDLVDVGEGPWDDCFVGVRWPVVVDWPGAVALSISADTDYAVVYNRRDEAWCVEPQTGPPDEPNTAPRWVTPLEPLVATTTWAWT